MPEIPEQRAARISSGAPDRKPAVLVPIREDHVDGVAALLQDADVQRFTPLPVPAPADFPGRWIARYLAARADGTQDMFAILAAEDGEFLGVAMAPRIERDQRTVELGYIVAPQWRGWGVASQALEAMTSWAFETLDAFRIELHIGVKNEASRRVATACGYRCEGTLRALHFRGGLRADTEVWSRLISDVHSQA